MLYYSINAYKHKTGYRSWVRIVQDGTRIAALVAASAAASLDEALEEAQALVCELKQEYQLEEL